MTIAQNATIRAQDTVNEVIVRHPESVAVFQRYGIDSCCGGALQLEEVCRRHGLDADALLTDLTRAAEADAA